MMVIEKYKEVLNKVLAILRPYRNDSYFNIYFYNMIEKLKGYVINRDIWGIINLDSDIVIIDGYEYMFIYDFLCNSCLYSSNILSIDIQAKEQYLINTFYELTHRNVTEGILNRFSYGFECFYTRGVLYQCASLEYKLTYVKNKLVKEYCLILMIDEDVVNCIDNSNDNVGFIIDDRCNVNKFIPKKQYNKNDINILYKLVNGSNMNNILYLLDYCVEIIKYKDSGSRLSRTKLMQNIIYTLICRILNEIQYENYIKVLLTYLFNLEYIESIITKLPNKYFKYIKKDKIKKLFNKLMNNYSEDKFKIMVKLTTI